MRIGMRQLVQTALNGSSMTIQEVCDISNATMSEFEGLRCGKQTTLAFVQSGKGVTHRLFHRLRILGNHRGFLPRAESPCPIRPDYQPNRVPRKPNTTVNKFRTLTGPPRPGPDSVFFLTGCRVSAVTGACVGHLETDGIDHFLHVTEKRNRKRRKILLDAARPLLAYIEQAGIKEDREGPLFRPLNPNGLGLARRHLDRETPWRLVKQYCEAAGIDPARLGARGIGIHSLRKTAINDAIRNGASMHEVREFAGHADIRTTEVYFIRKEEDAEVAARKIQIRLTGRKGE
jgi:integrase